MMMRLLRVPNGLARSPVARLPAVAARAYHQNIIDHYESPRNVGSLDKKDPRVGTGLVGAPACGDVMKLQVRVGEDGRVEEAVFKVRPRAFSPASGAPRPEAPMCLVLADVRLRLRDRELFVHDRVAQRQNPRGMWQH